MQGRHLSTKDIEFETEFIHYVNDETVFFGLAPWNEKYRKKKIVMSDSSLNVRSAVLE